MTTKAAILPVLVKQIKLLPGLVGETQSGMSPSKKLLFDTQVNTVLRRCTETIDRNVTALVAGKSIKLRRKISEAGKSNDSAMSAALQLINLLRLIEEHLGPIQKPLETKITEAVSESISSLSREVDKLSVRNESEIKSHWHSLNRNIEGLLRKLELLHPHSRQAFQATLWWFSQQGKSMDLDLLFGIRNKPPLALNELSKVIDKAEQGIVAREKKELLSFYQMTPQQLLSTIQKTIRNCRAVSSPYLKRAFKAEVPTQVIKHLEGIRRTLQVSLGPERAREWLNSPLELFDGKTARFALLAGETLPLLHLIKRFDEAPHY